eukprot:245201-Chlamydomonas_euryale.AAC.5
MIKLDKDGHVDTHTRTHTAWNPWSLNPCAILADGASCAFKDDNNNPLTYAQAGADWDSAPACTMGSPGEYDWSVQDKSGRWWSFESRLNV